MSSRKNSRIFQNTSVPDIAKSLFREHGFSDFEDALSQSYASREFVVMWMGRRVGAVELVQQVERHPLLLRSDTWRRRHVEHWSAFGP